MVRRDANMHMPLSNARAARASEQLLDRHEDVAELADRIRAEGVMGLDTEFVSERTYQPQLALLQVATRDEIFLIDPLADHIQEAPDQPIWDVMADPSVRTIVHAHDQEAQFCLQRTGRAPGELFDVQLAAAFSGHYYPIAYDKLVGRELRRGVGPSQSRTNWLQRPLTDAQRRYAAEDVRWLFRLHDRFVRRMSDDEEQQRFGWLREETQTRLDRLSRRETDRWRRLSGANKLSPRSLAALRELSAWRESVASARNIPFRRIASDDLLVAVSATRPTSQSELSSVRGSGNSNSLTSPTCSTRSRRRSRCQKKSCRPGRRGIMAASRRGWWCCSWSRCWRRRARSIRSTRSWWAAVRSCGRWSRGTRPGARRSTCRGC